MAYFNVNDKEHTDLLPAAVRVHPDLALVGADVATDVVEFFTKHMPATSGHYTGFYSGEAYNAGNSTYVFLRGYNPDSTVVTDSALVTALRRTIADVIAWRLGKRNEALHLASVTTQLGVGKQFKDDIIHPFPPGAWWYRLRRWDCRPVQYST